MKSAKSRMPLRLNTSGSPRSPLKDSSKEDVDIGIDIDVDIIDRYYRYSIVIV